MALHSFNLQASVCFEAKTQFSASQDLSFARHKCSMLPKMEKCQDNIWSMKPLDFSVRLYRSLSDSPKKQTGVRHRPRETKKKTGTSLPKVLLQSHRRTHSPKFITSFRRPETLQTELDFVKTGKYPWEPYKNPKPHDFRPLDEALPDIVTTCEKDPGNLKLKLKSLDIVQSNGCASGFSSTTNKTRLNTFKPAEPKWDSALILPVSPWPPQSASYTRHRRRRGAYSAFLDRVKEKLSKSWNC